MGSVSKSLALIAVLSVIASSLIMVKPACAQSTPLPSVPDFTIEPLGPSFDIPPTYSFNSSSRGFDINDGYHLEFSTVKIVIKNQPFTNQTNVDFLYYSVRIRPHNYPDSYWQELFSAGYEGFPIQTSSNYTVIPLSVEGTQTLGPIIPTGASTDIQVEAMIGHIGRNLTAGYPYVFFGETSGWSNIQTVTLPPKIPFTFSTPTPPPTTTPSSSINPNSITLPVNTFIAIIAVLALSLIALTALLLRRPRKSKETTAGTQSARTKLFRKQSKVSTLDELPHSFHSSQRLTAVVEEVRVRLELNGLSTHVSSKLGIFGHDI